VLKELPQAMEKEFRMNQEFKLLPLKVSVPTGPGIPPIPDLGRALDTGSGLNP